MEVSPRALHTESGEPRGRGFDVAVARVTREDAEMTTREELLQFRPSAQRLYADGDVTGQPGGSCEHQSQSAHAGAGRSGDLECHGASAATFERLRECLEDFAWLQQNPERTDASSCRLHPAYDRFRELTIQRDAVRAKKMNEVSGRV